MQHSSGMSATGDARGGQTNGNDYRSALTVATDCAIAAGAILRSACRRAGGPGGSPGHCDADDDAEHLIRETLTRAFPDWGYRGEETKPDLDPRDPGRHRWLIDPND